MLCKKLLFVVFIYSTICCFRRCGRLSFFCRSEITRTNEATEHIALTATSQLSSSGSPSIFIARKIAHAPALTQSAVESGVVLRLYSLLLNSNHCTCKRNYTVCCREGLMLRLYNLLQNTKHWAYK
jgi:hypothetical protein